jgi:phage/plasmid-like protein (TIGR03299 family)
MKQGNFELTGMDTEAAIQASGLNWTVRKSGILTNDGIECKNYTAIVREDNNSVLSVMGADYTPLQNTEVFAFADCIIKNDKNFTYNHSYVPKNGERYAISLKYNGEDEIRKGDKISSFLNLINGRDGGVKFCSGYTAFRVICGNTLRMAVKEAEIRIKHSIGIQERVTLALESINRIKIERENFIAVSKRLANAIIDKKTVDTFLNSLLDIKDIQEESTRTKNIRAEIENLIYSGKGNNGSSAWDSMNGVTEYVDHFANTEDRREYSANFGTGAKMKAKAFNLATQLIG